MEVKFETAKLAKEKGFHIIPKTAYYDLESGALLHTQRHSPNWHDMENQRSKCCIIAPTQEQLHTWIRNHHGKTIRIHPVYYGVDDVRTGGYEFIIYDMQDVDTEGTEKFDFNDVGFKLHFAWENDEDDSRTGDTIEFPTWEEAMEAALNMSLNLITVPDEVATEEG